MSTQTDSPTRRLFRYGDKTFPDPGTEHSIEQILQHLRQFFPELGHARTDTKTLDDGTLEVTFSKQVTTKN